MALQEGWQELSNQVSKLIARAWLDSDFQEQLIANPKETLISNGVSIPEGVEVQIDRNSFRWKIESIPETESALYTIPLPPKPADINDEDLTTWMTGSGESPQMLPKC